MVSGMTRTHLYPREADIMAMAMPVFPEVGSMMVPPCLRSPLASASLIMERTARSFMDPPGFFPSIFTYISLPAGAILLSLTRGVLPIASVSDLYIAISITIDNAI